jgi:LAS superfamily LD-carboxypeptidase LdcB
MNRSELESKVFIGIVEDNQDPKRLGRVRARIPIIFDEIPTEDIPWAKPWKDLNGNEFNAPEVGKIVSVVFDRGNPYKPEYIYAEHYNVNLENKLQSLSSDDYSSFKAILFDGSTQIFRSKSEGLKIDHEYSNINITQEGNINLNIRDNNSKVQIGSPDAAQSAVLGTAFMDWMDKFVDELLGEGGGPYLGNLSAPVLPTPGLIDVLIEYKTSRTPKFLSKNVWIVDNEEVKEQEREYINQTGDSWKSTTTQNNLSKIESTPYIPEKRPDTGRPEVLNNSVPNDITGDVINEAGVQTVSVSNYENGRIPIDKMVKNRFLEKDLGGDSSYLMKEASDALDAMMLAYNSAQFTGKQNIIFTDGYRSFERQQALFNKYGAGRAAAPGRSNHGWGIAIDMYWGVRTAMYKNPSKRPSGYKHPVYNWFFTNAYKFGWYNPVTLRDDVRTDEWWHWEYYGKVEEPNIVAARYNGPFEDIDISNIKSEGGTYRA